MKRFMLVLLIVLLFNLSSCFKAYKVGYNMDEDLIFSCDEEIGITAISIWNEVTNEPVLKITNKKDSKQSSRLYLMKANSGYDTDNEYFTFEAKSTYVATVSYGHAFVDVTLETNSEGQVVNAKSEKNCQ